MPQVNALNVWMEYINSFVEYSQLLCVFRVLDYCSPSIYFLLTVVVIVVAVVRFPFVVVAVAFYLGAAQAILFGI